MATNLHDELRTFLFELARERCTCPTPMEHSCHHCRGKYFFSLLPETNPDLGLVPTENLVQELQHRSDALVVALARNKGNGVHEREVYWNGSAQTIHWLINKLLYDFNEDEERTNRRPTHGN